MARTAPALVLFALAVAAPAGAADTLIGEFSEAVPISARGELLAYSRQDERGRWRLVIWEKGIPRDLPVGSREKPFDVDLGFHPGGAAAAYSRCERRRSCDLYRFDLQTGDEVRLARASTARADETRPAIHGGQVVFARGASLYRGETDDPDGRVRRITGKLPNGWDLHGGRVLITTGGFQPGKDRSDVYLRLITGDRSRQLAHAASGLLSSVDFPRPTLTGRRAFVAQVRRGAAGNRFVRVELRTGRRTEATGRGGVHFAVPLGDRVVYVTSNTNEPGMCTEPGDRPQLCRLLVTPPLTYR
jgi:hypothetical protein